MTVDTKITRRDFRAFVSFVARQGNPALRFLEPFLFGGGCAVILNLLGALFHIEYHGQTMIITLVASIATILLFVGFRSRRLFPANGGLVLGSKRITLSADGLRQSSEHHDSFYRWSLVRRIGETPQHIFIMLDRNAGLIIPRSSFSTPQESESFLAEVKKRSATI